MEILQVRNIKKTFRSEIILENLSCIVQEHSIFGLIGKNGAGKTTTMRMILGFLM